VKSNFLKNGFYNTVAGIIRIGLAILTIPLLIRLIGIEEYGLWTLASTVIIVVSVTKLLNRSNQRRIGNSYRLINRPITISCIRIDLEKQIVFLAKRLIRVLKVKCIRSIL
jgi:hypothetical protein